MNDADRLEAIRRKSADAQKIKEAEGLKFQPKPRPVQQHARTGPRISLIWAIAGLLAVAALVVLLDVLSSSYAATSDATTSPPSTTVQHS